MHRLKRTLALASAALVLVLSSFLIGLRVHSQAGAQAHSFRPFVLYERELNMSADNVVSKEVDFTVARRADGSLMRSFVIAGTASPNGEEGKVVFIWDVPAHMKVALEPFTKSAMTQYLASAEVVDFVSTENACSGIQVQLPNGSQALATMLGRPVIRVEQSDDMQRVVRWVAPDLDCYPLKKTIWFLEPQRDVSYQDTTATQIEEGSPPSSLFMLPSDYTERSPLELETEYTGKFGHPFYGPDGAKSGERQYRRHQASGKDGLQ